jgi:hypothetical protein
VELKEGELICLECDGVGFDDYTCPKCHGHGKLDWVEMIVGKNDGFMVEPGVYITEVDEMRKMIVGSLGIPPKYLGYKDKK